MSTSLSREGQARAPAQRWIEVYQSSPAVFDLPPLEPQSPFVTEDLAALFGPVEPVSGRLIMRLTVNYPIAGKRLRVRLSNEAGDRALRLRGGQVADGSGAQAQALLFGLEPAIRIPPRAPVLSDAFVAPETATDGVLQVEFDVVELTLPPRGIQRGAASMSLRAEGTETQVAGRPVVSGVELMTDEQPKVLVAFGDSFIDANGAESPTWARLALDRFGPPPAVILNAGIAGNRVISDGWGASMVGRLERDVLRHAEASYVLLSGGLNDIGMAGPSPMFKAEPPLETGDLIAAYQQISERVFASGKRLILSTLSPFAGSFFYSPEREDQRRRVNAWIRSSASDRWILDVDAVLQDASDPSALDPRYDSGDRLHPNRAGHEAIAAALDISTLT